MLTKTAEQLIGRRAKVKEGHYRDCIGRIDQITLNYRDEPATVRLFITPPIQDIYVSASQIDACTCGEGEGCSLCAEKPAIELPKSSAYGFPRRQCLYLMTPAELAIYNAVQAVEEVGADPLLTDAVVLLQQARDKVADYVDRK